MINLDFSHSSSYLSIIDSVSSNCPTPCESEKYEKYPNESEKENIIKFKISSDFYIFDKHYSITKLIEQALKEYKIVKGKRKKSKKTNNAEKKRKNELDNIEKKIRIHFINEMIVCINKKLKKAGSKCCFQKFKVSFFNGGKKFKLKLFDLTLKEFLSRGFDKKTKKEKYENLDVIEYLSRNEEISRKSGFDKFKDMKIIDIYKNEYFNSFQFRDKIVNIKDSTEYCKKLIVLAKNLFTYLEGHIHIVKNNSNDLNNKSQIPKSDDIKNSDSIIDLSSKDSMLEQNSNCINKSNLPMSNYFDNSIDDSFEPDEQSLKSESNYPNNVCFKKKISEISINYPKPNEKNDLDSQEFLSESINEVTNGFTQNFDEIKYNENKHGNLKDCFLGRKKKHDNEQNGNISKKC